MICSLVDDGSLSFFSQTSRAFSSTWVQEDVPKCAAREEGECESNTGDTAGN